MKYIDMKSVNKCIVYIYFDVYHSEREYFFSHLHKNLKWVAVINYMKLNANGDSEIFYVRFIGMHDDSREDNLHI